MADKRDNSLRIPIRDRIRISHVLTIVKLIDAVLEVMGSNG